MILVSILGDFHSSILPVFYEYSKDIKKHILVYDDAKRDSFDAKSISKGLRKFIKKHHLNIELLEYRVDEDSFESIKKCAEYITKKDELRDIYVNTTDGYSTLTTVLHHLLFKYGINFIAYDRYDNEYNMINFEGITKHKIKNNMDIDTHFMLKGIETYPSDLIEFANDCETMIKDIFENYADEYSKFIKLSDAKYPYVFNIPNRFSIKQIFGAMGLENYRIKDSLLTGGLFECYVYLMVKDMGYDDIKLSYKIGRNYGDSEIVNEFDLLIMKENHLHTVECKFRNKVVLEDLIYKYTALGNIVDDDGKIALITKNAKRDKFDNKNKNLTFKRGKLSNIEVFDNIYHDKAKFYLNIKNFLGI